MLGLPRVHSIPQWSTSAGSEIVDLMDRLNRPLDPWQQWIVLNGLGEVRPAPDLPLEVAASRCGCWVPRQNGKGDIIMALELGWLFLFGIPLITHSAHEYKTAQEGFLRIKGMVEGSPDLDPLVNRYWQANGEQGLELKRSAGGARLRFMSRTKGAGRGFSAPKVVLDEAQELTEFQMRAILPVVSAQENWQIWFFGTPPQPENEADTTSDAWIYNLRDAGMRGAPRTMWVDYGIETIDFDDPAEVATLYDPEVWRRTNPAFNIRIKEQTIRDERDIMGDRGFAMERCGMWLPRTRNASNSDIDAAKWEAAIVPEAHRELPENLTIAFHVNTRRTHATVGYAGVMPGGGWQVGVLEHFRGTADLLDRLVELVAQYNPIAVTVDTKNETTITDLAARGIKLPEDPEKPRRGELILPTSGDVAMSYGMFVDAVNHGHLQHHNEVPLNRAIEAGGRPLAGGQTWDHKRGIEVGPAVCAGLAMWAHRERADKVVDTYDPLSNIW